MNHYIIIFIGREVGETGALYEISEEVTASDAFEAHQVLHEGGANSGKQYEHIKVIYVELAK